MTLTVEAIYENGVLKPAQPLPLQEHAKVRVTVETPPLDILQAHGIGCNRRSVAGQALKPR
jgi:predicted DNA-binding antitoxin AbrB/MazE fold protein